MRDEPHVGKVVRQSQKNCPGNYGCGIGKELLHLELEIDELSAGGHAKEDDCADARHGEHESVAQRRICAIPGAQVAECQQTNRNQANGEGHRALSGAESHHRGLEVAGKHRCQIPFQFRKGMRPEENPREGNAQVHKCNRDCL